MYWWSDFDFGEVQEELAIIHELDLTHIRIFLLCDDFQPAPDKISMSKLKNLEKLCDIAESYHLKLNVTYFTGHMSGSNWAPRWMLHEEKPIYVKQVVSGGKIVESGYLNPYADKLVLSAQIYQLK